MTSLKYVIGDATAPRGSDTRIIAHICNDYGGWGAGFVLALSKKNVKPECGYRQWYREKDLLPGIMHHWPTFELGEICFAPFSDNIYVCNMIAQRGNQVDYFALEQCLQKLAIAAKVAHASIHIPRIGCGLGGGDWTKVKKIVQKELCAHNLEVTVYDLPD